MKVYTVNGAVAGSSSSIPDWLIRKRAAKGKGKRVAKEHVQGAIELIQGFEFPEASNKITTTKDGHHAIATGTYKPQTRVWDLDDLNLKFERHSDAENVDFIVSPIFLFLMQAHDDLGSRSYRMIGQRSCTCRMIVLSSCTLREGFIIGLAYRASVGHWHITFHHAPHSSQLQETRYIDSTSNKGVFSVP